MLNKGKILWCIWAGILVLLFLMFPTDLIIKEEETEVYPVSIIIEGDNDDYYVNLKEGMDQTVVGFHGDVSLTTLYADHDQAQQMELVKRGIRDGAGAMILVPVKSKEAVRKLRDMNPNRSAILLGQSSDEGTALDIIGVNGGEIGRLLGEAVASQVSRDVSVHFFCGGLNYGDSAWVYEGVRTVLDEQGYHYRLIERKNQGTYRQVIQGTDIPGGGRITIIALDVQLLDQVTRIPGEDTIYQGRVAGLYDTRSTILLLRVLDRGTATGPTAYNQFDEGYLSMKQAVEVIQGIRQRQNIMSEAIYVDKDKLEDKVYEKMPYPIE